MVVKINPYPGCCRTFVINTVGPVHGTKRKKDSQELLRHITMAYFARRNETVAPYITLMKNDRRYLSGLRDAHTNFYQMWLLDGLQDTEIQYAKELGFQWQSKRPDGYRRHFHMFDISGDQLMLKMKKAMEEWPSNSMLGRAVDLRNSRMRHQIGEPQWTYGIVVDDSPNSSSMYSNTEYVRVMYGREGMGLPLEQSVEKRTVMGALIADAEMFIRNGIDQTAYLRDRYLADAAG